MSVRRMRKSIVRILPRGRGPCWWRLRRFPLRLSGNKFPAPCEEANMKTNEIKTIFDYNFWAFERVWKCISKISDEQFVQEIDYSTGSVRNILVHIMAGNRVWMSVLRGIEFPPRLLFEDFDSHSKTKAKWDELQREFLDHLNCLDQ